MKGIRSFGLRQGVEMKGGFGYYRIEFLVALNLNKHWERVVADVPCSCVNSPISSPDGTAEAIAWAYETNCGGRYNTNAVALYAYWACHDDNPDACTCGGCCKDPYMA